MYKNELRDDAKLRAAIDKEKSRYIDDIVFAYPEYTIPDNEVPKKLKNYGCQINREFLFLKVSYDEILKRCVFVDTRIGKEINPDDIKGGGAYGNNIDIKDIVLVMNKDDYNKAKENSAKIMALPIEKREAAAEALSDKDNQLALAYFQYVDIEARQKPYYFAHEAHHIETNIKIAEREETNGSLNASDYYKSCEDSEKSAYFQEVLKVVEAYHKANNYNSFKAFTGTRYNWLKNDLKKTPPEDRKNLVADMEYLINGAIKSWDNSPNAEIYRAEGSQFEAKTKNYIDINGEVKNNDTSKEYEAHKSIYFTYDIYNPDTKSYFEKDLSSVIKEETKIGARAERFLYMQKVGARKKEISEPAHNNFEKSIIVSKEEVKETKLNFSTIKNFFSSKRKR